MGCFCLINQCGDFKLFSFSTLVRATYYFKYETDVESTTPPKSIIYHLLKATLTKYFSKAFVKFSHFGFTIYQKFGTFSS